MESGAIAAALSVSPFTLFSYSAEDIRTFQLKDDTIAKVIQAKEQDVRPPGDSTNCFTAFTLTQNSSYLVVIVLIGQIWPVFTLY